MLAQLYFSYRETSYYYISLPFVFFFQAEDGIRDLVRSRGLGDVYKRQLLGGSNFSTLEVEIYLRVLKLPNLPLAALLSIVPVSYTHLTLPTSDLV